MIMILNEDYFDDLDIKEEDLVVDDDVNEFTSAKDFIDYCKSQYSCEITMAIPYKQQIPDVTLVKHINRLWDYVLDYYNVEHTDVFAADWLVLDDTKTYDIKDCGFIYISQSESKYKIHMPYKPNQLYVYLFSCINIPSMSEKKAWKFVNTLNDFTKNRSGVKSDYLSIKKESDNSVISIIDTQYVKNYQYKDFKNIFDL